jgi:AT-rich interactive domain-containing protein 1
MVSTQQQYVNESYVKKSSSNNDLTQQQQQQNEFQRPPSSNTPRSPGGGGGDSNSSFHEDDTMMSSPNSSMQASSPKQHHLTNANANLNNSSSNHASSTDVFQKLLDMGSEFDRKIFVDRLQIVWEEFNIQCRNLPNISKHPLDLYKLYNSVRDKGGFNEVTKLKLWKDISLVLKIANSATAAFNVKKKYVQLGVFHYECKYDRGGTDPLPLINDMEKTSKKASNTKTGIFFFCKIFI